MSTVCDFETVQTYRELREVEQRIEALAYLIDSVPDLSKRGELKAKRYSLKMQACALRARMVGE